ncbi:TolC family protein [Immundisolibacter sp.]|uniref:TolC family protein n=1 Tax=Immundisolibacter sp. TaxID=1934948 RepID=UPI00356A8E1C
MVAIGMILPLRQFRGKLFLLCAGMVLFARPVYCLDLAESMQLAKENDPRWSRLEATYMASGEKASQVRGATRPELGFRAGYALQNYKSETAGIRVGDSPLAQTIVEFFFPDLGKPVNETFTSQSWGVFARYGLWNRDVWQRAKGAKFFESQAEAEYRAGKQSLLMEVAQTYFSALSALIDQNFATAELRASGAQREQVRHRYEQGLVKDTDVYAMDAAFDQSGSNLRLAKGKLNIARGRLGALVGNEVSKISVMADDVQIDEVEPSDVRHWTKMAEEMSPALQARLFAANAARKEYQARKAAHHPKVDLVARYDDIVNKGGSGFTPAAQQASVGVEVSMPIYSGGRIAAAAREAAHRWTEAKDLAREERIRVRREAQEQFETVNLSAQSVMFRKKVITTRTKAVDQAESDFKEGLGSFSQYVEAIRMSVAAQREYEAARIDYILELLRFRMAVGTLQEQDIEDVDRWLVDTTGGNRAD